MFDGLASVVSHPNAGRREDGREEQRHWQNIANGNCTRIDLEFPHSRIIHIRDGDCRSRIHGQFNVGKAGICMEEGDDIDGS